MKATFIKLSLLLLIFTHPFFAEAQNKEEYSFDAPTNFYVTPTGMATWDTVNESQNEFLQYTLWLDGIFTTDLSINQYDYSAYPVWPLVPNQTYQAQIKAEYSLEYSEGIIFEFIYLPSGFFQGHEEIYTEEYQNNILFSWNPISSKKEDYECIGTNIYKNGDLLMYVPIPDTSFIYENPPGGFYTYCLTRVYTEDGGLHSWDSELEENCTLIGYTEQANPPSNLIAYRTDTNQNTVALHWEAPPMNKNRDFLNYHIYKEGELLNTAPVLDTFYYDYAVSSEDICYEISAIYSQGGESELSNTACILTIGLGNELDIKSNLYPNPANASINIASDNQIKSIKFFNQLGQSLKTINDINTKNYLFDISKYEAGIYFLEIKYEQGKLTKKLIIQK